MVGAAEPRFELQASTLPLARLGRSSPCSRACWIASGVAGVGVTHDARARVGGQHPLEPFGCVGRAVGDDDHAGVDRVADPDPAAVVDADPGRARGDVQQGVQDRPVGDRVGAVGHRLRLAVRRCDRARIEVIPPDHHRRGHSPAAHELVDRQARSGAVAVAEPADPRGQPLECDPLGCQLQPPLQDTVLREQLQQRRVDRGDVRRIARQRGPPERPDAAAEERPDIGRDEARVCERILDARL